METTRFAVIPRLLAEPRSRRQALHRFVAAAAVLTGGSVVGAGMAEAKPGGNGKGNQKGGKGKKKGNEKVTLCHNGHTIRVARPAVRAHLKQGATEGPCASA